MEFLIKTQKANDYNLKKSDSMSNKLFLVCPFSSMENFIREKYGDNVFFMTAMAAILNFNSEEISAIKLFIEREKVS